MEEVEKKSSIDKCRFPLALVLGWQWICVDGKKSEEKTIRVIGSFFDWYFIYIDIVINGNRI